MDALRRTSGIVGQRMSWDQRYRVIGFEGPLDSRKKKYNVMNLDWQPVFHSISFRASLDCDFTYS